MKVRPRMSSAMGDWAREPKKLLLWWLLATIWPAIGSPATREWPLVVSSSSGPLRGEGFKLEPPLMVVLEFLFGMKGREEGDVFCSIFGLGYQVLTCLKPNSLS